MQRTRNTSRFSPIHHHATREDFLSARPGDGLHVVRYGTQTIDLLIADRHADATLVVFHSALTARERHTPVLQGRGLAEASGMNLVSIADPSIELGDIDLAWYLGNRGTGRLPTVIAPLIGHSVDSLGGSRTVFFGASGGGYAAINATRSFTDAVVLAVNPRLSMKSRPLPAMGPYLDVCHGATSATPQRRIRGEFVVEDLAQSFALSGIPQTLLIFQNTGDTVYLDNQLRPFLSTMRADPNLYLKLEHTEAGHKPIPTALLHHMLVQLSNTRVALAAAVFSAGFRPAAATEIGA